MNEKKPKPQGRLIKPSPNMEMSGNGHNPYSDNLAEYFLFLDRAALVSFCEASVNAVKALDKSKAHNADVFERCRNKVIDAWTDFQNKDSDGPAHFDHLLQSIAQAARLIVLKDLKKKREAADAQPKNAISAVWKERSSEVARSIKARTAAEQKSDFQAPISPMWAKILGCKEPK